MSSTSTSSINPASGSGTSNMLRITGMASGLDVDATVKAMMTPYQTKMDKLNQDMQTMQWTQTSYRDTLSDINTFKSTFLDLTNPTSYMLSQNAYAGFDTSSLDSLSSLANPAVTATAGSGAVAGNYIVSNVTLATKATITSAVSNISQADTAISSADFTSGTNGINVKLNGVNIAITPTNNDATLADMISDLNTAISGTALNGKLIAQASPDGTKVQFVAKTNDSFNISNVTGGTGLSKLGYTATSFDINQSTTDSISKLFGGTTATFSIQSGTGTPVSFNYNFAAGGAQSGWTIAQVLNDISTNTGMNASYSQLSRTFSLTSSATGSAQSATVTADDNNFLNSIFGTAINTAYKGTDATATIQNPQGVTATVVKSTNNFNIDGINYNLIQNNTTSNTNITVTSNVQKTYDGIKAFIDKYNDMISKISTKIHENKSKDYPPLTDAQKASMSATDITNWEAKAKVGLLQNDSMLNNMLTSMRSSFFQSVQGAGISLSQIGLSTSSDYTQGGKIIIDETKLKAAIQNNGQQVANIFSKQSTSFSSYDPNASSANKATRSSEEGIFQRINDILKDYTRTTRDSAGHKGLLVDKAGIVGDYTEFNNLITTQETAQQKAIAAMTTKMSDKQTAYYNQFSKLEVAMNALNNQQATLSSMLGTSSSG